jgi:tight adherence protein C
VAAPIGESGFKEKQKKRFKDALVFVGKFVSTNTASSQSQVMLLRAGFRRPDARPAIAGVRILLPVILVAAAYFSGLYREHAVLVFPGAVLLGYMVPEIWFLRRVRARQRRLRVALPDGLDLLVVCVEAGLGLDQALLRVTMLIQTERFGTSIAQSLRVFSEELRTKRRQRAEEMAAKISVKMVPVLVLFIFPALMIVVLGPAIVSIMRQFLKL